MFTFYKSHSPADPLHCMIPSLKLARHGRSTLKKKNGEILLHSDSQFT